MLIRKIAVVVGLVALLILYYWIHKPINLAVIVSVGGALLDILTVGAIGAAAGGIGRRLLRRVDLTAFSRAERIALEGLLGLSVIAWGALLLGLIGLFRGVILWAVLIVAALICVRGVFGWLADVRSVFRSVMRLDSGWSRLLAAIFALLFVTAALRSLTPPTAWDSLAYHLVGPKLDLAEGRINPQPDNLHLGLPEGGEMIFGVAMSLFGRDTAAAPAHFLFGVLALLAVGGLVRRFAGMDAAWFAVVLLLSAYSVWSLFSEPYVDMAVMAYGAVALSLIMRWRSLAAEQKVHNQQLLILMGLYAGLAVGIKFTALGVPFALAVCVIYELRRTPRTMIRQLVILSVVTVLAFIPWMVKAALLYKNPVFPYFFGGLNWDSIRTATYNGFGTGLLSSPNIWQLPILPLAATVYGVDRVAGMDFTTGPWLFTLPLLLVVGWRWLDGRVKPLAVSCLLFGGSLVIYWMVTAAVSGNGLQTRLMTMLLPPAAVAGSLAFSTVARWPRKPLDLFFVLRGIVTVTLLLICLEVVQATLQADTIGYLMSWVDRDTYLTDYLGTHIDAMRHLATLPAGSQVRFLWEPRSYYCPATVTCLPDSMLDAWFEPIAQGHTPDQVFSQWKQDGVSYVLMWDSGFAAYSQDPRQGPALAQFPDAFARWMQPVWTDSNGYTLFTWKS